MKAEDPRAFGNRLFRAEWHQTRRKGRKRFVWMMAAIWGAAFGGGYVAAQIYKGQFNILIDFAFVMATVAAGYFVGTIAWGHSEKKFLSGPEQVSPPGPTLDAPRDGNGPAAP